MKDDPSKAEIIALIEQAAQGRTGDPGEQSRALEVIANPPGTGAEPCEWLERLFYVVGEDVTERAYRRAFGRNPE